MKHYIRLYISVLLSFSTLSAQEKRDAPAAPLVRKLSIDNGYIKNFNSNRAIKDFDLELSQGFGAVYDFFEKQYQPQTLFGRGLYYFLFNMATWGPARGQMATLHEMGHNSRYRSIGIDSTFINVGKEAAIFLSGNKEFTINDVMSENYFTTILASTLVTIPMPFVWEASGILPKYDRKLLFTPENANQFYNANHMQKLQKKFKVALSQQYNTKTHNDQADLEEISDLIKKTIAPKAKVVISAGGPNIQQDRARNAENHLWYNGGDHLTIMNTYFWDKTWSGFQSTLSKGKNYSDNQDTTKICNAYNEMGINLTHSKIIKYAYLSYFLSTQTYANIYQIYKTITAGENKVYAPEYYGVKLPNVGLYFTTKGPTYNIGSGYKFSDTLFIPLSIEFGLSESAWEVMLGVRKKYPPYYNAFVHMEVVFNNEAIGASIYGGAEWLNKWTAQVGLTYHNAKTLQGERNIPCYKDGDTDIEAWLKLGITY